MPHGIEGWTFELSMTRRHAEAARDAFERSASLLSGDLSTLVAMRQEGLIPVGVTAREDEAAHGIEPAVEALSGVVDRLCGAPFASMGRCLVRRPERIDVLRAASARIDAAVEVGVPCLVLEGAEALVASEALDLYSRLCMGQVDEIAQVLLVEHRIAELGGRFDGDAAEDVRQAATDLRRRFGFGRSYLGIGSADVRDEAKLAWEVKKVLDREAAFARDPRPGFRGVEYDGLTVRYLRDPAPTCVASPPASGHVP